MRHGICMQNPNFVFAGSGGLRDTWNHEGVKSAHISTK